MIAAITLLAFAIAEPAAAAPRVEAFWPQGYVKRARQAGARFSEAMLPFGDLRGREDPFRVSCPVPGTGRWADPKNWVYDFERELPAGLRCRFEPKEGGGAFEFHTGGPAVLESEPGTWRYGGIEEEQIFALRVDAQPDPESVRNHVYFRVAGLLDRIGVRFIEGEARRQIIKAAGSEWEAAASTQVVVLAAKRSFPASGRVDLVWGKGAAAVSGIARDQDQVLTYKIRAPFTAELTCERANADAGCIPFLPIRLRFSAPVSPKDLARVEMRGPGGAGWKPATGKDDDADVNTAEFSGPFPPLAGLTIHLPADMADDSGRRLENAAKFPLPIKTDDYPPLAKFGASFGILELKTGGVLPVTLRNIESAVKTRRLKVEPAAPEGMPGLASRLMGRAMRLPPAKAPDVLTWLARANRSSSDWKQSIFAGTPASPKEFELPKPNGAKAFEVVGIPLSAPGFYVLEVESAILGQALYAEPTPMHVPTAALVTNLAAHLKWGREGSLVWVTRLDTGAPAAGARVAAQNCKGELLWEGTTDAVGVARAVLPRRDDLPLCSYAESYGLARLMVTAAAGDDMTFTLDTWDDGIEPYRFDLPTSWEDESPIEITTVFDRTLLRAGETVHMKHVARRQDIGGFSYPAPGVLPGGLVITHYGSDQSYKLPLVWDKTGIAESRWEIPREAGLGTYLLNISTGGPSYHSGRFQVEEFRVPLTRAVITPPADPLVAASTAALGLSARYLAGGPLEGLPVKLRTRLQPRGAPDFPLFEGFVFANGPVETGRGARTMPTDGTLRRTERVLDKNGTDRVEVQLPLRQTPLDLHAELEYSDPNGEVQTVSARVPVWPASRLVGLKADDWASSGQTVKIKAAVADLSGRAAAGVPVTVALYQRKTISHRKRLVGGFYSYDHSETTVSLSTGCSGITDERGLLRCEIACSETGNILIEARAADARGRETAAKSEVWVYGKGEWWYSVSDSDRMDLLPERKRYEPGETALFQARVPFAESTALVTVEREGVIDVFVRKLTRKNPVIRIPVKSRYAPNVFVSVLAVRGRVGGEKPTALADLGRPAFRLGASEIRVGWRGHELKVAVKPEREVYRSRQRARAKLQVRSADGSALPPGAEAAVAVVDEGLLELAPNRSWELLDAMMGRRSHAVRSATAQMHVVGRRHFGLKALPQGGGGGKSPTRELFDTLLFWKPRVPIRPDGTAWIDFPLNDSLTSFRIEAVATAGPGRFGSGGTSIRSTRELQLFSGLPPLVREGDRFRARFTLRNASQQPLKAEVRGRATGRPEAFTAEARLAPGEAQELSWEVEAPTGAGEMVYELEANAPGASDGIKVKQRVVPAVPVRTRQATLQQIEGSATIPVASPAGALPGRGGVRIALKPSLTVGLEGLREYMRNYPFGCLEQRVSQAVALGDASLWNRIDAELPSYLDAEGLAKYFPTMEQGSETLTSYLVSIAHEADWKLPEGPRERMVEGLKAFVEGRLLRRSAFPTADLTLRQVAALEALSRHLAGPEVERLLQLIPAEPQLWPTSAVIDWLAINQRLDRPGVQKRRREAEQVLRSRLNFQGTVMGFSTERTDGLWWLMVSNDLNSVRLLLSVLKSPEWREDLPRLARGAIERQNRGHWDLTLANAWGRLAVEKFAGAFESRPVAGVTGAALGSGKAPWDWTSPPGAGALTLPWPAQPSDLILMHQGSGKPWAEIRSLAAVPLREPLSSGYAIKKSWTPIERKKPDAWSRGDVVRVTLELEAQADRTWVVVADPVPAGATILGRGLGRESTQLTSGESSTGWAWPAYEERSFEAYRAYYETAPKGRWTTEYTLRLNNEGTFQLPPTRVEAMYAPEMFGEIPNPPVSVAP